MFRLDTQDRKHLSSLLTPSWLSGLIAVLAGLVLTIGVITAFSVNNSTIQQQLTAWQQDQPQKPLTTPDEVLEENDKPTLQGSWPLILIWSFVGLVTYTIAASIMHSLSEAIALKKSLNYVNAKPTALLKTAAERVILRVLAAGVFAILTSLLFSRVVPYAISASHASAADIISLDGALYAFLSFAIIAITLHVQTIFVRLAVGKIRIFSSY